MAQLNRLSSSVRHVLRINSGTCRRHYSNIYNVHHKTRNRRHPSIQNYDIIQHTQRFTSSSSNTTKIHKDHKDHKLSSSCDETADPTSPSSTTHESLACKLDPRAVFPWRHSPHPLPRLLPHTEEYQSQGGYLGPHMFNTNKVVRAMAWINAAGFLQAKVLGYGVWKRDLEYSFMHAFAVGVQGVLDDVYTKGGGSGSDSNGVDEDVGDEEEDEKETKAEDENIAAEDDEQEEEENIAEDEQAEDIQEEVFPIEFTHTISPDNDEINTKTDDATQIQSSNMLESNLISLYRSARTYGKHQLQIKLRCRPKLSEIQSLFVFPFLTRTEVEDHISLKHSYKNIAKAIHDETQEMGRSLNFYEIGQVVAKQLDVMADDQRMRRKRSSREDLRGYNNSMTIVAQVAMQCDEIFVVRDVETGDVVQGDEEEKVNDVTHLVRFEMVVDLNVETGMFRLGTWQITDWDDLLDGNVWFV